MLNIKQVIMFIVVFLAMSIVVQAEEQTIKLTLRQAEGNQEIKNVWLNIIILDKESNEERIISSFIRTNPITLRLEPGDYLLKFQIDDLQTPGKDYYAEQELLLENPRDQEVIAFPVGSVKGVVYDTLNNLVSEAVLKVECSREYGERFPIETDRVGSFSLNYAPLGECVITATANNAVGSGRITVEKGVSHTLEIRLNRAVISEGGNQWTIFWSIVIIVLLAGLGWFGWKYWQKSQKFVQHMPPSQEKKQEEQQSQEKISKRTQDILNTLNEKEKKVVMFLLNHQHTSTQAKIRYESGIPKTTLVRIFISLQNKKIISIETMGKLKKIKLTNWFLDKEN
ncbi:MAG: hypothetical protein Q8L34_01685 [Candidatus Woesearchaeota archaeon]|nr:hypothetical protein [Candidatus Woesearchaeota archaeon]